MARDNWNTLANKLGDAAFGTICHGYGRKLDTFRDATHTVAVAFDVFDQLVKVELNDDPFGDLPYDCANSIFIAVVDDEEYLVNTEGFSYCRYIAKVKVL